MDLVLLRPRTPADEGPLAALLLRVHAVDGYPLHATPEQALAYLRSGRQAAAWVAEQDGALVGHVALHSPVRDDPSYTTLRHAAEVTGLPGLVLVARLFVDPGLRRAGVGRALLRHAAGQARADGRRAVLDVGQELTAAVALYEAEGWTRLGALHETYDGVGIDLWVYLSPPDSAAPTS